MYFKTKILCKLLPAKPALSARATRPPDWCTNMLYFKGLIPRALFHGEMRNISPVSFELRPLE
jgi:hypothetical protein